MAGAGYKLFNTGDVLTAAQVNTYLQEQVVMRFANATARTTALSGVLAEGMMSYLDDTNSVEVYNGSAWVSIGSTGDITGVTAGTGISGGGTSGDVTITNSMATAIDAKGDLIVGTGADTFSRLAVGTTNGHTLQVDSSTATGLRWAATSAGFSDWTTWTPTWTNVTVGNGTVRARYTQSNKVVLATILLQFGSTTSITANNPRFTLPITAVDPGTLSGSDYMIGISSYAGDWNTQGWKIDLFQTSTTSAYFQVLTTSDTYGKYNAVTSTIPITFGTSDILMATFMYEAA